MKDWSPEAKAALDRARDVGPPPTALDRAQVRAALDARLAATSNVPPAATSMAVKAAWVLALALAGLAVALIAALRTPPRATPRPGQRAPIAARATVLPPVAVPALPPPIAAPPVALSAAVAPATVRATSVVAARRSQPRARTALAPTGPPPPRPAPAPHDSPPVSPTPSASPDARASGATPVGDLAAELALLRRAQIVLRAGRATEALAVLDEYALRFARGSLREECAMLRIFALCGAGRAREARVAADRFLVEAADSPGAARVRASCAFDAPRAGP